MRTDMDLERRARQRDKTDVFADESEALDQIAKQVNEAFCMSDIGVMHGDPGNILMQNQDDLCLSLASRQVCHANLCPILAKHIS